MTPEQGELIIRWLQTISLQLDRQHADHQAFVQVLTAPLPEAAPAPCTHPPDVRTDSRAGARFWKCHDCGYVYDSEKEQPNAALPQ